MNERKERMVTSEQPAILTQRVSSGSSQRPECLDLEDAKAALAALVHLPPV
jgi:hypothetical protein